MRVVRTSKLSTNAAAVHYKVPKAYLVENKRSKTVLLLKQEELFQRIIRLAQTGYPITLKILRMCVHIL